MRTFISKWDCVVSFHYQILTLKRAFFKVLFLYQGLFLVWCNQEKLEFLWSSDFFFFFFGRNFLNYFWLKIGLLIPCMSWTQMNILNDCLYYGCRCWGYMSRWEQWLIHYKQCHDTAVGFMLAMMTFLLNHWFPRVLITCLCVSFFLSFSQK